MRGMLLGFWDGISQPLNKLVTWIVDGLMELVAKILGPIINILINIVTYAVSIYLYNISVFILALIDYVEVLFRALAGLESDVVMSLSNSEGAGDDLLLQLIRSKDIQQAFLAMCIVGLFLLVVTSVFQIIKLEYTTEGAKNSKTPVLQKAFKSLANLMLLPILVVFGIYFSNQLLGLLDTATKGSQRATISGTLFSVSASEARYKENDLQVGLVTTVPQWAMVNLIPNIVSIFWNSINEETEWGSQGEYLWSDSEFKSVEEGFQEQADGYKYYNIGDVCKYYDYSRINYLLLIFGGCTVLKCLYFSCFGMVMRLYKCAVLFIISPAVIGMTPINEGGLGKWRGQFIGQVLSAYGTILSINIFFTIVDVLLQIDVNFTSGGAIAAFSNLFMSGLFKMIIVIVGCLMIEKFAKDLGGFFGAEDAMGAGKDMSKQVTDVAMKGVQVAATVAGAAMTGGASLVSSAGSLAGKLTAGKKAGDAAFKEAKLMGKSDEEASVAAKAARKEARQEAWGGPLFESKESRHNRKLAGYENSIIDSNKKINERQKAESAAYQGANDKLLSQWHGMSADEKQGESGQKILKQMQSNARAKNAIDTDIAQRETSIKDWESKRDTHQKNVKRGLGGRMADKASDKISHIPDTVAKADVWMQSYAAGARKDVIGRIPGMKQIQDMQKTAESGAKIAGPHHEAVLAGIKKDKEKKVQDKAEGTWAVGQLQAKGAMIAADRITDEMGILKENALKSAEKIVDQLKKNMAIAKAEGASNDQILSMRMNAQNQLEGLGANIDLQGVDNLLNGTLKLDASTLHLDFNPKAIQAAVKEAMEKGHSMDSIKEALVGEFKKMGAEGNVNLLKQIEAIIQKVMSDMGGK